MKLTVAFVLLFTALVFAEEVLQPENAEVESAAEDAKRSKRGIYGYGGYGLGYGGLGGYGYGYGFPSYGVKVYRPYYGGYYGGYYPKLYGGYGYGLGHGGYYW